MGSTETRCDVTWHDMVWISYHIFAVPNPVGVVNDNHLIDNSSGLTFTNSSRTRIKFFLTSKTFAKETLLPSTDAPLLSAFALCFYCRLLCLRGLVFNDVRTNRGAELFQRQQRSSLPLQTNFVLLLNDMPHRTSHDRSWLLCMYWRNHMVGLSFHLTQFGHAPIRTTNPSIYWVCDNKENCYKFGEEPKRSSSIRSVPCWRFAETVVKSWSRKTCGVYDSFQRKRW